MVHFVYVIHLPRGEVNVPVLVRVGIVYCFRLEILDRNDPFVSVDVIVTAKEEFSPALLAPILTCPHGHAQHKCRPIGAYLEGLDDVVNEFEGN